MKKFIIPGLILALYLTGPLYLLFSGKINLTTHWQTADRSSAHIALDPKKNPEAVVQIYAARAYGWRAMFAVHTWFALKPKNANKYRVIQALGWHFFMNKPYIDSRLDIPDRKWFGNTPKILLTLKGKKAQIAIQEINNAVANYPYHTRYFLWPGPNSNTFAAYVIRHCPSIKIALPITAIGKDYLPGWIFVDETPSKTGIRFSVKGLFGFALAKKEGFEFNVLGLIIAINSQKPYIHLPGFG